MDSTHVAKLLSLFARGVITAPDIANSLLVELIRGDSSDAELPSFMAGLPDEVQQRLRDLLREVQKAEYRWRPFMLGPGGSVLRSEADDSARLRQLCGVLETAQAVETSAPRRGRSEGI
jgi:hypothetical protein